MDPSDSELVHRARAGEAEAWTLLLSRHRAAMQAVAVAVVGPGRDADDVVQDACLVALTGLSRLRQPDRVRSWLTGICRNLARQARRTELRALSAHPERHVDGGSPEELLAATGCRDWVWHAVDQLSEVHRQVVVLRYFTAVMSYQTISAVLDIPVGTVRSRLHDARAALRATLPLLEPTAHPDHARLERDRVAIHTQIVEEYNRGADLVQLRSVLTPEARLTATGAGEVARGAEHIARELEHDVAAGVQLTMLGLIASEDLTVVEAAFRNPATDPHHCPPLTAQVFMHREERIESIHLHYATT